MPLFHQFNNFVETRAETMAKTRDCGNQTYFAFVDIVLCTKIDKKLYSKHLFVKRLENIFSFNNVLPDDVGHGQPMPMQ